MSNFLTAEEISPFNTPIGTPINTSINSKRTDSDDSVLPIDVPHNSPNTPRNYSPILRRNLITKMTSLSKSWTTDDFENA